MTEMTELTTPQVLHAAADYLRVYGWTKGGGWFPTHGEPACVEGAIRAVCASERFPGGYDVGRHNAAKTAVAEYLGTIPGVSVSGKCGTFLFLWNDGQATDAEHVIATLRATALMVEAREESRQVVTA